MACCYIIYISKYLHTPSNRGDFRNTPRGGTHVFQSNLNLNVQLGVSKNSGTPKSSILIGISIINQPFWGKHPYSRKHPTEFTPDPQELIIALNVTTWGFSLGLVTWCHGGRWGGFWPLGKNKKTWDFLRLALGGWVLVVDFCGLLFCVGCWLLLFFYCWLLIVAAVVAVAILKMKNHYHIIHI